MLEKDLVYELIKDKDKVCENYIWCVFLEKLSSLNKDSHYYIVTPQYLFKDLHIVILLITETQ